MVIYESKSHKYSFKLYDGASEKKSTKNQPQGMACTSFDKTYLTNTYELVKQKLNMDAQNVELMSEQGSSKTSLCTDIETMLWTLHINKHRIRDENNTETYIFVGSV